MPYISNSELPSTVTNVLPAEAQTIFREAFNSYYYSHDGENVNADLLEERSFSTAWSAVNEEFTKPEDSEEWVRKDMFPQPLYVHRKVVNAQEVIDWAKSQGFETTLPADDLHVTVLYSRNPVNWFDMEQDWVGDEKDGEMTIKPGGPRIVNQFGDAIVVQFASTFLAWRHEEMVRNGASHDFEEYSPHITITYQKPDDLDLSSVEPYQGRIVLGPEIFQELKENWKDGIIEKQFRVIKADDEQQIAFGWASVTKRDGIPVVDLQGDVIENSELLKFTSDFMLKQNRQSLEMHAGQKIGEVIHSFPMLDDIAKSLGIQSSQEGWIVGVKIYDDDVWQKVKTGELGAFSIGAKAKRVVIDE